ncbi:unnamed protein product [Thelazia callipaeda]|uniref:Glutaredoxin domain-containing protein n=1 Tax=Thelazia callipaeda TaxID=103827 RepID=A0A0N5CJ78_THECL|nr:unnamed protein product [Thelazia callipaeda]
MGQFFSKMPQTDEESIRKEVESSPVVLYTRPKCHYCAKAKLLLDSRQVKYKETDLDAHERWHPEQHQSFVNGLVHITKQTSVPQIFICGKFIGGFLELQQLNNAGKLLDAIAKCHPSSETNSE